MGKAWEYWGGEDVYDLGGGTDEEGGAWYPISWWYNAKLDMISRPRLERERER